MRPLVALLLAFVLAPAAPAATHVVTNFGDSTAANDPGPPGSLRYILLSKQTKPGDTIMFASPSEVAANGPIRVPQRLVAWRHDRPVVPPAPALAVDPVCGMETVVDAAKETAVHEGHTYFFCCSGCRSRFVADPARYLAVETP